MGLACPDTKQLCCYIGDVYRVEGALQDLELVVQKHKDGDEEPFVDSIIMYEVLSELKDIAARDGISCTCGAKNCAIPSTAARWIWCVETAAAVCASPPPPTRIWTVCAATIL